MADVTGTDGPDSLVGTDGDDYITGLGGDDILNGGSGDDILDGGTGADKLGGGYGNDTYYVDNAGDLVYDPGGTNTVIASVSYYTPANIQTVKLTADAGDAYLVGNDALNFLWGNQGNNILIGNGGQDILYGFEGNDQLFGGDGRDEMLGNQGDDVIIGGADDDKAYGGEGADHLYGGDGDDLLYGETFPYGMVDSSSDTLVGGDGDDGLYGNSGQGEQDFLDGGAGDDVYVVDSANDLTFEAVDGGTDTVVAQIAGTSGGVYLYANVENLVLDGTTYFGVGNALANHIYGNNSDNLLLGGDGDDVISGGLGNDVMYGQGGADIFASFGGGDTIADFQPGTDKIDLGFNPYFTSFADVVSHLVEYNGTTAINLGGGDYIVLTGVANSALHAGDFIFHGFDAKQPLAAARVIGEDHAAPLVHEMWGGQALIDDSPLMLP